MSDRWTPETEELVLDAAWLERADAIKLLTALAASGLLVQPGTEGREEWRVTGEPGEGFPSYTCHFLDEETARKFVALVTRPDHAPWDDGPHLTHRTVLTGPWRPADVPAGGNDG